MIMTGQYAHHNGVYHFAGRPGGPRSDTRWNLEARAEAGKRPLCPSSPTPRSESRASAAEIGARRADPCRTRALRLHTAGHASGEPGPRGRVLVGHTRYRGGKLAGELDAVHQHLQIGRITRVSGVQLDKPGDGQIVVAIEGVAKDTEVGLQLVLLLPFHRPTRQRQHSGGENADDPDHDDQLDQREAGRRGAARVPRTDRSSVP